MRRAHQLAAFLTVLSLAGASAGEAATPATMTDIAGQYLVMLKSSISVTRAGKDKNVSSGVCTLAVVDDANGTFDLLEYAGPYEWKSTGRVAIIPGGKKAAYMHDDAGFQELRAVLTTWLTNWASSGGITLTGLTFSFDSIKYIPVALRAKTIQRKPVLIQNVMPRKAKLTIKGVVSGLANGVPESRKFTYMSDITFMEKF